MGLIAVTGKLSLEGSEGVSWVRLSRQREQPGQRRASKPQLGQMGGVGEQIRACESMPYQPLLRWERSLPS